MWASCKTIYGYGSANIGVALFFLAGQYVFSHLLSLVGLHFGLVMPFCLFFPFFSSLFGLAFIRLGWDEVKDWIEELVENHGLN